jgi:hypothetical protein
MLYLKHASRTALLDATRTLIYSSQAAQEHLVIAQHLKMIERTAEDLWKNIRAREQVAQQMSDLASTHQQLEETLDAQLIGLCQNLQTLGRIGDSLAVAAHKKLFPNGPSAWLSSTARMQLVLYETFALLLNYTPLPIRIIEQSQQIQEAIHAFIISAAQKEHGRQSLSKATAELQATEETLKSALRSLEQEAICLLSPEAFTQWVTHANTLLHSSDRAKSQSISI